MMKRLKITAILIVVLMMFAMLPIEAKAAGDRYYYTDDTGIKWIYSLDEEGFATVIRNNDSSRHELTVPPVMDGHRVLYIGDFTFSGCTELVTVSLPDGIIGIGEKAFGDCSGLMSISLPDTVTSIGEAAFEGCESLTAVTIPAGVTAIGNSVFKNSAGIETVVLPKCTAIGDNAFSGIADGAVLYYPGTSAEWEAVTKGIGAVPASCTVRNYDDQTDTVEVNVIGLESDDQLILTDGLGTRRELTNSGSYGVWSKDTKLTVKAGEGRRCEGTLAYQQADGSMAFFSQISSMGSPNVELSLNKGKPCVSITFDDGETGAHRLIVNEQLLDILGDNPSWKIKSGEQEYSNRDVIYTESSGMGEGKYFTLELTKTEGYTCEGGLYGAKSGRRIVEITDETTYVFNNMSVSDEDLILSLIWYETGARHTAIVDGGLGSGKYKRDDIVTITAAAPTNGKTFNQWTGTEGVSFADAASAMTTFTMPDADVTVTATYKDMDTVAAPSINLASGTYYSAQNVELSSVTEGATIYYTTDGSVPSIYSRKYTDAIRVTETTTIKAIAVKKDMKDSEVTEAFYNIAEEPTFSLIVGVPKFDAVTEGYTQPEAKAISIKNTGNSDATISSVTLSGDGQNAFLLNKTMGMTIEAGVTDNTTYTIQPKDGLAVGTYTAEVAVAYDNDTVEREAVSFTVNSDEVIDTVAAPTFSPEVGGVISGTDITISCETEGATILYDTNGSNAPSTEYTGPIRITEETTISAIAIKEGMSPSDVVTAIYTIQTPSSENYTVIFKAAGGTWTDGTTTDKEVTVENGNAATAPEDPTREGFTFDSWDKDFSNVTSDLTVTAQWKENTTPPQPQEPISIEDAKVVLSVTSFNYNGKVRKPAIKTIGGKTLSEGTDYIAEWSNASSKNAGTYTVTITGKGNYAGTTSATYKIKKAANPLKLKEKKPLVKYEKLKKKNQTLAANKVMTFKKKTNDKKNYKLSSAKKGTKSFKKYFMINKATGKITVKKGLKKGTYKVKVKVKAKGNANYMASAWKSVTLTIKVK